MHNCVAYSNGPSRPLTRSHSISECERAHRVNAGWHSIADTIMNYVASPRSNSISHLFIFTASRKWQSVTPPPQNQSDGLTELPSVRPEKMLCWLFGFEAAEKWHGPLSGVFGDGGLLCVTLFVWVCQNMCRVLCTRSYWRTPPRAVVIQIHRPDLSCWITLLFPL